MSHREAADLRSHAHGEFCHKVNLTLRLPVFGFDCRVLHSLLTSLQHTVGNSGPPPYNGQVATWLLRSARFAMCAAEAALTPASAGARGVSRVRTHSAQFVRCIRPPFT